MSEVSGWVFTICSGALICGVVSALIPSKSYEGAIQLLLGLFMLFCFLVPVSLHWELPKVDLEAIEDKRLEVASGAEKQLNEQVARDSVETLKKTACEVLSQYGLREDEIGISLGVDEQDRSYAVVSLPQRCQEQHAVFLRLLEYEFGIPVQIEYN